MKFNCFQHTHPVVTSGKLTLRNEAISPLLLLRLTAHHASQLRDEIYRREEFSLFRAKIPIYGRDSCYFLYLDLIKLFNGELLPRSWLLLITV